MPVGGQLIDESDYIIRKKFCKGIRNPYSHFNKRMEPSHEKTRDPRL